MANKSQSPQDVLAAAEKASQRSFSQYGSEYGTPPAAAGANKNKASSTANILDQAIKLSDQKMGRQYQEDYGVPPKRAIPATPNSESSKNAPASKRAATLADWAKVGIEEGVTPFIPSMVAKGAYGAATTEGNALSKGAGAVINAFDPNSTLYAKAKGVEFAQDPGWTGMAANLAGNVLGAAMKIGGGAALGGVGAVPAAADAAAQLGSRLLAGKVAKATLRALPYQAAKQSVGALGGAGGAHLASSLANDSIENSNLTPKEKDELRTLIAVGGGLTGGIGASIGASKAVKANPLARAIREASVEGSAIPTYEQIDKAKILKKKQRDQNSNLENIINKEEPQTNLKDKGGELSEALAHDTVTPSQVPEFAASTLGKVKDYLTAVKGASINAKKMLGAELGDKTLSKENALRLQDELGSFRQSISSAAGEEGALRSRYSPNEGGKVSLSEGTDLLMLPDNKIELNNKGKIIDQLKTNAASDNIHTLIQAHNELNNPEIYPKGEHAGVFDNPLQSYLNDIYSSGKTAAEGTGILKSTLSKLGLPEHAINELVKKSAVPQAADVIKAYNNASIPAPKSVGTLPKDIALEYLSNNRKDGLNEAEATNLANSLIEKSANKSKHEELLKNINEFSKNQVQHSLGHSEKALTEFVSPRGQAGGEELNDLFSKLSQKIGDEKGLAVKGWFDKANSPSSSIPDKISNLENIYTLFNSMGGLMRSNSPEGFAHPGMAGVIKYATKDIPETIKQLHFADYLEQVARKGEHVNDIDVTLAREFAKTATKRSLNKKELMLDDNKRTALADEADLVSPQLIQATEALYKSNKTHPLSIISGRDVASGSWIKKVDADLRSLSNNALNLDAVNNMLTTLNEAQTLNSNSSPYIRKAKNQLKTIRDKIIEQEYGEKAPDYINAINFLDKAQSRNIKSSKEHPLTDDSLSFGQRDTSKPLQGHEAFDIDETIAKLKEAEPYLRKINPDNPVTKQLEQIEQMGSTAKQHLEKLSKSTGNYDKFLNTHRSLAAHAREEYKNDSLHGDTTGMRSYQDVYAFHNPRSKTSSGTPLDEGLAEGVLVGGKDTKKIDNLKLQADTLNDVNHFVSKEAQSKAQKTFLDELFDGTINQLENTSHKILQENKSGNKLSGTSGYTQGDFSGIIKSLTNVSNNIGELVGQDLAIPNKNNLSKLIQQSPELMTFHPQSSFMQAVGQMTHPTARNVINTTLDKLSAKTPNTKELVGLSERNDAMLQNFLRTYKDLYPHEDITKISSLDNIDFKDKRKTGLLTNIMGAAILKSPLGMLHSLLHGGETPDNIKRIGKTSKEAQAEALRDLSVMLSNPYRKDPRTGQTYAQMIKENIKEADKILKKTKNPKNLLTKEGFVPMMTYGNTTGRAARTAYAPFTGLEKSFYEDSEKNKKPH